MTKARVAFSGLVSLSRFTSFALKVSPVSHTTWARIFVLLPLLTLSVFYSGCAAPGSGLGRIGVVGEIKSAQEIPATLSVTLPKTYGLGGMDTFFGKPEDYGNRNITIDAPVENGRVTAIFPPVIYHITFWLLPPLGGFPRHPPPPVFRVRFSDIPEEYYLVGYYRGVFQYRVFDSYSHQRKDQTEGRWVLTQGKYLPENPEDKRSSTWILRFEARQQMNSGADAPTSQSQPYHP